jgi:hypothetical protein
MKPVFPAIILQECYELSSSKDADRLCTDHIQPVFFSSSSARPDPFLAAEKCREPADWRFSREWIKSGKISPWHSPNRP